MCTALFFYDIHPTLLFLLAFNREEYQERCGLGGHLQVYTLDLRYSKENLAYTLESTNVYRTDTADSYRASTLGSIPVSAMPIHILQADRTSALLARPSRPAGCTGLERRWDVAWCHQEWKGGLAHKFP